MKRDNHNNDRDYDYDHERGKKLIALVVSASSFLVLCLSMVRGRNDNRYINGIKETQHQK